MKINPTEISWTAPTENVDGTPVTEPLSYTLGVHDGADFVEQISFPGTLNADGNYTAPIESLNLPQGVSTISLLAFYVSDPETTKSDWANPLDVHLGLQPNPPFGLDAA